MSQTLKKVLDVDPNSSEAVKDALSAFFQTLPKHTEVECIRWLRALENVINRFPKYCFPHRNTIELYLINFLDSDNYYNVIEAAKCAHALQQVRPSHEKTATAKSCWRDQMSILCNAAHKLLTVVFPHAIDIYHDRGQTEKVPRTTDTPLSAALSCISTVAGKTKNSSVQNKHAVLCTRLKNVFVFLQAMLVEVYPVVKPIRPQIILDVVVRALSVSSGIKHGSHDSSDVIMVKTQALRCIDSLVACLGPNLIPFSPLIIRFVMQTLKWSSDNPSEEASKVRCVAYHSLDQWLSVLHIERTAPARGRCWVDEFAAHVLADVTPPRRVVQLTMNAQPTKNLSKKAKRRLANTMLQESAIAAHAPGEKNKISTSEETNDEVAIAALECAQRFLIACGVFLKPAIHKSFQERLVRECYNIGTYAHDRAVALLRALDACRKCAPPGVPPPTQYCLQLYSVLVNSQHREISNLCSQALLDIRLHLHCSPPSLNYALEVQPEPDKRRTGDKKKISEKNRAALIALLGADKLPPQSNEGEVITIPDEPSNKKPRLEADVDDRISLSSGIDNSVEISDDSVAESAVQEVAVVIEPEENKGPCEEEIDVDESEDEGSDESDAMQVDVIDGNDATQLEKDNDTTIVEDNNSNIKEADESSLPRLIDEVISKEVERISEVDLTEQEKVINIFEAPTQMPLNTSTDTVDEDERPLSIEVAYDYPSTGKEKVKILEEIEEENLPSTGDSGDIQITCGQVVKSSQDIEVDKKSDDSEPKLVIDLAKVNGIDEPPQKIFENGNISEHLSNKDDIVTAKVATNNDGATVEDMLADFVDEVNEDTQVNT